MAKRMLLQLRWCVSPYVFAVLPLLLLSNVLNAALFSKWAEVSQEELAMSAPKIDPTAPAEILYHETIVDDSTVDAKFSYYKRVKIFDARAIESFSPLNIPYRKNTRIRNVEARVIKPNGEIVELEKADMYDREVYRRGDIRTRVKSINIPGVEPGCIVEYRWEAVARSQTTGSAIYTPVQEFPVHRSYFGFLPWPEWRLYYNWFAMPTKPEMKRGELSVEVYDMMAEPEDSYQPPFYDVYPWVSCYYFMPKGAVTPEVYWPEMAKVLGEWNKKFLAPKNRAVRRKAEELTKGATTDEERIQRIYDFCVNEIRNYEWPDSGFTAAELSKLDTNDNPGQTLERGYGDSSDLMLLFGSLAGAAGLDAKIALVNDSSMATFSETLAWFLAVPDWLIAIRSGDKYTFYDVSTRHLRAGELMARNSGVRALVGSSKKDWKWVTTQTMPENHSRTEHSANLVLDENGNLTGQVEIRYFGEDAVFMKGRLESQTNEWRREYFRDQLRDRLPGADITDLVFANLIGYAQPMVARFNVSVPNYAERLGDRLLLPPSFFEKGKQPMFVSESRKTAIYFERGWNEIASVQFELPEGWTLESAEGLEGVIDTERFSHKTHIEGNGRTLKFERREKAARMTLPMESYKHIKVLFEEINRRDQLPVIFSKTAAG